MFRPLRQHVLFIGSSIRSPRLPLKPADESSTRPKVKKRSHSISRLPVQRPTNGLSRNATVISYSPTKRRSDPALEVQQDSERAGSAPPMTPAKSEANWSTNGTPARTPQRDINPALLRGAVVFVDVHTSEEPMRAASSVELLFSDGCTMCQELGVEPQPLHQRGGWTLVRAWHHTRRLEKMVASGRWKRCGESGGVVQCGRCKLGARVS